MKKPHDIGLGNDFLYMTPKAQATKANTDKWDYVKLHSKGNNQQSRQGQEKIFINHASDKG
jgi:hypothetical protein